MPRSLRITEKARVRTSTSHDTRLVIPDLRKKEEGELMAANIFRTSRKFVEAELLPRSCPFVLSEAGLCHRQQFPLWFFESEAQLHRLTLLQESSLIRCLILRTEAKKSCPFITVTATSRTLELPIFWQMPMRLITSSSSSIPPTKTLCNPTQESQLEIVADHLTEKASCYYLGSRH